MISGAISKYDEKYTVFFQKTLDEGQSEYQQVFLFGGWTFGNVAELGFFGWTDADTAYARRKETPGLMLILR